MHTVQAPELHAAFQERNDGAPEPFDGIAEVWFESLDAMQAARGPEATKAGQELLEDERRFIDLPRSPMWVGGQHVIVDRTGS